MTTFDWILIIAVLGVTASVQVVGWLTKWRSSALAKIFAITVVVKSIALVMLLIEHTTLSGLSIILLFFVLGSIGYCVELLGVKTAFPFGPYHYTKLWVPRLFGVPLLLVPAWFCFVLIPFVVASSVAAIPFFIVILTAQLTSSIDVIIDPLCTQIGIWKWHKKGSFFGIPLQNFMGWFATTLMMTPLLFPFAINFTPSLFPPVLTLFSIELIMQCFAYVFLWPWKNWKIALIAAVLQGWPIALLLS